MHHDPVLALKVKSMIYNGTRCRVSYHGYKMNITVKNMTITQHKDGALTFMAPDGGRIKIDERQLEWINFNNTVVQLSPLAYMEEKIKRAQAQREAKQNETTNTL